MQSRVIWTGSFLFGLAMHALLVLPWLWHEPKLLAGAGGQHRGRHQFCLADPGVLETKDVNLVTPAIPSASRCRRGRYFGGGKDKAPRDIKNNKSIRLRGAQQPVAKPRETRSRERWRRQARAVFVHTPNGSRRPLARTKPKGIGAQGIAKVRFTIVLSGRLGSVQLVSSSGDRKLDQKAIDAVQQAMVPHRRRGITVPQLTDEIP